MKRIGKFLFIVLLSIFLFNFVYAQQADSFWATDEVKILGAGGLTVSPSSQVVPLNIPTEVETSVGSRVFPQTWIIKAKLEGPIGDGPRYYEDESIMTLPNQPFQIPPIPIAGTYLLKEIKLMNGEQVIAEGVPSQVEIQVMDLVITSVTARPMTLQEIQDAGIVINLNDYKAVRYTIGFGLQSETIFLDFPVLFDKTDITKPPIILNQLSLPGPPPLPNVLPPSYNPPMICLKCLDLEPVELEVELFDEPELPPGLSLQGVLIFPSSITFLNQFFAVGILIQNDAPLGTSLTLKNLNATITFPDGSLFELRSTNPPIDPLSPTTPLPIINTTDGSTILMPQMQGKGEYKISTPKPGTYTVKINFTGDLLGLPSGEVVPIHGTSSGVITVRDPEFHLTFVHPSVVRKDQEYSMLVTVTNTSQVAANLVSMEFDRIEGAHLLSGTPFDAHWETIPAGGSVSQEFHLVAERTGIVTTTSSRSTNGTTGTIILSTGIGEGDIPLSPDTLVLPDIVREELDDELINSAYDLLGMGWSLANTPPSLRPVGMPGIAKNAVEARAGDLTLVSRKLKFSLGEDFYNEEMALSELALNWLSNGSENRAWDAVRRIPPQDIDGIIYPSRGYVFAQTLGQLLSQGGKTPIDIHSSWIAATRTMNPSLSFVIQTQSGSEKPEIWLEDSKGKKLGDSEATGGYSRDIPYGEFYNLPGGRLFALGRVDSSETYTIKTEGTGNGTYSLDLLAPFDDGAKRIKFENIPSTSSSKSRVVITGNSGEIVLEQDLDGTGNFILLTPTSIEDVPEPPLTVIGCAQDMMADHSGRAIAVIFNKALDKAIAEDISNYSLNTRTLTGAYHQSDLRTVVLSSQSRICPLSENYLTLSNSLSPAAAAPLFVKTFLDMSVGSVHGRVFGEDGFPLSSAVVYL